MAVLVLFAILAAARDLTLSGSAVFTLRAGSTHETGFRITPRLRQGVYAQFGDFKLPEFKLPEMSFAPGGNGGDKGPVEATSDEDDARAKERTEAQLVSRTDEPDIGERLFSLFFGEPQEGEVAGLARTGGVSATAPTIAWPAHALGVLLSIPRSFNTEMHSDALPQAPDTYPATTTEFASPLPGDSAEAQLLRPMLKNTNLEFLPLRLAYDSGQHGWSAAAWHGQVDKTGPCLVIAQTEGGALCGGYAPKGFAGYGETRGSIAAFLFTWADGDTSRPVVKLRKIGGAGLATIDEPETGPRFGSDGFIVGMNPGSERVATTKLGPYYEVMPSSARSIFAPGEGQTRFGTTSTTLTSLRTYVGVWPEGERIPYDGAIPFAIE